MSIDAMEFPGDLGSMREGILMMNTANQLVFLNSVAKKMFAIQEVQTPIYFADYLQHVVSEQSLTETIPADEILHILNHKIINCDEEAVFRTYSSDHYQWLSFRSFHIQIQGVFYTKISVIDVTDQVNEKHILLNKNNDLNVFLSAIEDFVFEQTIDGVILSYWAHDHEKMMFLPEKFLNRNIKELFDEQLANDMLEFQREALHSKSLKQFRYSLDLDELKTLWFSMKVVPLLSHADRIIVVITDITSIVEKEKLTQFNITKLSQAFHNSKVGMAIVDCEGNFINANRTLADLFGISFENILSLCFKEITHPDDVQKTHDLIDKLLKGEFKSFVLEKRYRHHSGEYFWCLATISLVSDVNGIFFLTQIQDLSLFKKNEQILQHQKEQLELVNKTLKSKISQLEEFNHIVAHNLRATASNMDMLIQTFEFEKSQEGKDEILGLLKQSNSSLLTMLQHLMELLEIRNSGNVFYYCIIQNVFNGVKNSFVNEIRELSPIINMQLEVEMVYFPRIYLESCFFNLLSNSLKYIRKGQQVIIDIHVFKENGKTKMTFTDNGIGIDLKRYGNQVFNYRKTFHSGFESQGIGLFMTKNQLESSGAKIYVDSEPNQWTTFTIEFPNE